MKFKGFNDWIEIFRGGRQVDSRGNEHDGDVVIDKALASFDPREHEPPLTVGHPEDNSPAFGWVEGLKEAVKDGVKVLMAKFRQVAPDFEDLVKQGLFKKRSASFYPDGRLRHVGFLGAAPPAVKGLADMAFAEKGEFIAFVTGDDAGQVLHEKILEIMQTKGPKRDHYGREFAEPISYRDAMNFVMEANPELAEQYIQSL